MLVQDGLLLLYAGLLLRGSAAAPVGAGSARTRDGLRNEEADA